MRRIEYQAGHRFGRLTFIRELSPIKVKSTSYRIALFKCYCGNEAKLVLGNVRQGYTKSCGCYNTAVTTIRNTTHNLSKTWLYKKWIMIKYRCYNKNARSYSNYGARGIGLAKRWQIFTQFYNDMQESYQKHIQQFGRENTTIERIDFNGNYSKTNCRWATFLEQASNRSDNKQIFYKGKKYTIRGIAEKHGLTRNQLAKRLSLKWTLERALSVPLRRY